MAENTVYFETIVASRSALLSDEEALAGDGMLSLETIEDEQRYDIFIFARERPLEFLTLLQYLQPEDREIMLEYYVLGVPQALIGQWHRRGQTRVSQMIRESVDTLGAIILFGGPPTAELMSEVFRKYGVEDLLPVPLSLLFAEFVRERSYEEAAKRYKVSRARFRAASREVANLLRTKTDDVRARALGAILWKWVDGADPVAGAHTRRHLARFAHWYRRDPDCLGQFRIDVTSPGFDAVFTSKANR